MEKGGDDKASKVAVSHLGEWSLFFEPLEHVSRDPVVSLSLAREEVLWEDDGLRVFL